MNPKNMKKYQNLLWLGVPEKKRDGVRGVRSTQYMDPNHVVFIQLTSPPDSLESTEVMQYDQYIGDGEGIIRPIPLGDDYRTVMIATEFLRKIIDNVTADHVTIMVSDDRPICISWADGGDDWKTLIAPRIKSE